MSQFNEIKKQIAEAKQLKVTQQMEVDQARRQWQQALERQHETIVRIAKLQEELREEAQKAFDEDGTLIREWM